VRSKHLRSYMMSIVKSGYNGIGRDSDVCQFQTHISVRSKHLLSYFCVLQNLLITALAETPMSTCFRHISVRSKHLLSYLCQSHITTDGQSVSMSFCLALDQRFFFKGTVLSLWGTFSDERSGQSRLCPTFD
jgi:hypothetical protein